MFSVLQTYTEILEVIRIFLLLMCLLCLQFLYIQCGLKRQLTY